MNLYRQLYYKLYMFLESFEGGFSYQTDSYRSIVTVVIISLLELFNLMSAFPQAISGNILFAPFLVLCIANYIFFVKGKKYKKIIELCKHMNNSFGYSVFVILYVVGTFAIFVLTR